jgi:hypothetical protein
VYGLGVRIRCTDWVYGLRVIGVGVGYQSRFRFWLAFTGLRIIFGYVLGRRLGSWSGLDSELVMVGYGTCSGMGYSGQGWNQNRLLLGSW